MHRANCTQCRFSWQTVAKLLQDGGVQMTFEADEADAEQPKLAFGKAAATAATAAPARHSFFRTRRLQPAAAAAW